MLAISKLFYGSKNKNKIKSESYSPGTATKSNLMILPDKANAGTLAAHTKPDRTTFHSDSSEDELALAPKVTSTSAIGTPEEAGRPGGVMATAGGLGEATTTSPAAKTSSSSSGSKRRPSVRPVPTVILERTKKDKDCEGMFLHLSSQEPSCLKGLGGWVGLY